MIDGIDNLNFLSTGTVTESAAGNQKLNEQQSVNNQSESSAGQSVFNSIGNSNSLGTGTGIVKQSVDGNQKLNEQQSVNNQASGSFAEQGIINSLANINDESTGTVTQSATGNLKLDKSIRQQSIRIFR